MLRPLAILAATSLVASLAVSTAATAANEEYYGCITPETDLIGVGVGETPADHCAGDQTLIEWNQEGPQGAQGEKGNKGNKGDPGEKGNKGNKGDPGEKGNKGDAGPPGADGIDGANGADGQQGPEGPPGADGTDGAPGATGSEGAQGEQGLSGEAGEPGAPGEQGEQGPQGEQGEQGLQGEDGEDADLDTVVQLGVENVSLARTIVRATIGTALWGIGDGPEGSAGLGGYSAAGTGVHAGSDTGYGLRVASGRIKVDEASGIATISAGSRRVIVNPDLDVNDDTLILVTPHTNLRGRSFWVTRSQEGDTFQIHISRARGSQSGFSWLMIERS
jgi:hypothetical protein